MFAIKNRETQRKTNALKNNSGSKDNEMQVFVKNKRKKFMNFIFHKTNEIKDNSVNGMCYIDTNENNVFLIMISFLHVRAYYVYMYMTYLSESFLLYV